MQHTRPSMSPWRFVVAFGTVSLLADMVYEGARSVSGPFLASLGAGAALVGLITGAGEALALAGRLVTGTLADRTRAYWPLTLAGYAVTVVAVPLLGLASALWMAAALVTVERAGKAIRSPAKDVLLSHAASAVGRGRGFGVHKAMDQVGALLGPLIMAAVLVASAGDYRPAFWVLVIPGIAVMVVLLRLRRRVPNPGQYEASPVVTAVSPGTAQRLPSAFWAYLAFTVLTALGCATFGVLSFHLADRGVVAPAAVPVVYASAMAVSAVAAVSTGWLYDRIGRASLALVPPLSAAVPMLAFQGTAVPVIVGILLWGAVLGIQDSTMRAAVADLVPVTRRGTAYGVFAAGFGVATFAGSTLIGVLYAHSVAVTIVVVVVIQSAALLVLLVQRVRRRTAARR